MHQNAPKYECLNLLQMLFERVPEFEATPTLRHALKSVARLCRICEVQGSHLSRLMLTAPALVVVLEGNKDVGFQNGSVRAHEGDFLLLPNGVEMDIANNPGSKGLYRSVVVEFEPHALRRFAILYPDRVKDLVRWNTAHPRHSAFSPDIHVAEAFMHLSRSLARGEDTGPILELRMFELILALLESGRGHLLFSLTGDDIVETVQHLITLSPAQQWTAERIAAQLGVSVSTLSRRLRQDGLNLRQMLREARMQHAGTLLKNNSEDIAGIAESCGYASLSRFRARFEDHFGITPTAYATSQQGA
ncbi:AraC family transcriptional regulator [Desulfovibrio mangrovi]|uniref:helix-turn-helix transcriptional regulator n=1 Tax=Desulfovibrio mangrovi TaxID=2976983 RepID=UPI002247487D|nr:AraC family transcriptional regulator [Desulfovibrio mangrovi]UZP67058.1 AraC family transcriptional regulator [Desulfovibrio mangrovi]